MKNNHIGEILVDMGYITQQQLNEVLKKQKEYGDKRVGTIMMDLGYLTEAQFMKGLAKRHHLPFVSLDVLPEMKDPAALVSEELARKYTVVPYGANDNTLTIATVDPMNFYAIEEIKYYSGKEINTVIATSQDIKNAIERIYTRKNAEEAAETLNKEYVAEDLGEFDAEAETRIDSAPVVRLVNSIIAQAIKLEASDIHIEPLSNTSRVRMRIDGDLTETMKINIKAHGSLVTRIKIIGGMNIAERRLPQDGRVELPVGNRLVDLRISVLPTVTGEKVVIRILGGVNSLPTRQQLGFSPANEALLEEIMKNSTGMILVSGPTGSGKTTTVYSLLRELDKSSANIITIEDPVEFRVNGINQVQVNNKTGLTFANGLRSILRQDPDIIMVGEIRDSETAEIAVRAAITGHIVLSTIHTNDSVSAINRFVDMGVPAYLLTNALSGIIAQRLVKKICPKCKEAYQPSAGEMKMLGIGPDTLLYRGAGCSYCENKGYRGRMAIHEIAVMDKELRTLVDAHATTDTLRECAKRHGTKDLQESCKELVLEGVTTTEELIKVTYSI